MKDRTYRQRVADAIRAGDHMDLFDATTYHENSSVMWHDAQTGYSPLHDAVVCCSSMDHLVCIELLLQSADGDALATAQTHRGDTALHILRYNRSAEWAARCADVLLMYPSVRATADVRNSNGYTAVVAIRRSNLPSSRRIALLKSMAVARIW